MTATLTRMPAAAVLCLSLSLPLSPGRLWSKPTDEKLQRAWTDEQLYISALFYGLADT